MQGNDDCLCCFRQADKRLQLADWRVRPLTADMLHYARADTHFLLYIADCLRVCVGSAALRHAPASMHPAEHS